MNVSASEAGAVYILLGPWAGSSAPVDADAVVFNGNAGDRAGFSIAGGRDLNGDVYPDLFIGAPMTDTGDENAGVAYLFTGGTGL